MSTNLFIPNNYKPILSPRETEKAILLIKDYFQTNLAFELNLQRITAPLFVKSGTGINDDLNGIEKPISFPIGQMNGSSAEIVQSLAKWKRLTLARLNFKPGEGIYTDMNAIRPDDVLDNIHSLYVDQWDWERVITEEERTLSFLKKTVRRIYDVIRRTERYICHQFPALQPFLPEELQFVNSQELENRYPNLTPKQRESAITSECGAIFLIGIGGQLKSGDIHDGRAPDYDDWSSPNEEGFFGLNGDIIVRNPLFDSAYELSSMGIRVNRSSLEKQLDIRDVPTRRRLYFHQQLLNGQLPLSIGGGIGQSRLCMLYLQKAHIGEIQSSIWPEDMTVECQKNNIFLL